MKVTDRYILREFFRNFLWSLLFFTILLLVVRFSEKEMGGFISRHMSVSSSILSLVFQVPSFVIQVAPPSVLFATFFSLGRMAQNNEITAMKAAGMSLYRIFQPVFIAAFLIALFMIVFNDQVVTWANEKEADIKDSYSRTSGVARYVVFASSGGRMFYIYLMFPRNHRMQNVTIYEFDEDNNLLRETFAREVSWSGETWYLKDGIVRTLKESPQFPVFDMASPTQSKSAAQPERGWEETPYEHKEITVPEDPEIMVKETRDLKEMSFAELSKLIKYKKLAERSVRRDLVSLNDKISFPFACFIMAILGAPLFVIFGRSGMAVGFLLTMFISFLYWSIAIAVFEAFGNNGKLPPMLSCWAANFIFAVVGAGFVYKVKK
jgi:lipopolysaccharide export system permease protein